MRGVHGDLSDDECSHFVLVGLFHGQKMFRDQLNKRTY